MGDYKGILSLELGLIIQPDDLGDGHCGSTIVDPLGCNDVGSPVGRTVPVAFYRNVVPVEGLHAKFVIRIVDYDLGRGTRDRHAACAVLNRHISGNSYVLGCGWRIGIKILGNVRCRRIGDLIA